jgi:hypothetical protein
MKKWLVTALCLMTSSIAATAHASPYLFQYSGTVSTVGGTVTDGSLLPFAVGDIVSGSFVFDSPSPSPPPGTPSAFYPLSIESFLFGSFAAVGTQRSYSYFLVDATNGYINAFERSLV